MAGQDPPAGTLAEKRSLRAKKRLAFLEKNEKVAKLPDPSVWIGNISYQVTEGEIQQFLSSKVAADQIKKIKLPTQKDEEGNVKNRGFAVVTFATEDCVGKALELSEVRLSGRHVLIKSEKDYRRTGWEGKTSPSLFVGNLFFECTAQDLAPIFKEFGAYSKIRVATFEDSGRCKGFAYVDYLDLSSATKCMKSIRQRPLKLHGRTLKIQFATPEATKKGRPWERETERERSERDE